MVCIQCGQNTEVSNSRHQKRANRVWRRRKCLSCGSVFTTQEQALYQASWLVKGKKSSLTPFSRDKLFLSLYKSCQHRKHAVSDAGGLADSIIGLLSRQVQSGMIDSSAIKSTVSVALSRFDKAASTHYQAYHSS